MKEWELQHQYPRLPSCPQILSFTLMCTDLQRKQPDNKSSYAVLHLVAQSCRTLRPHGLQPARLLGPWGFSKQEYWRRLPGPPLGIFPTQGSNPGLPHCKWVLHRLSHQGSPWILEWVAYPFSREFPDPGIKLGSHALQEDSLPAKLPGKPVSLHIKYQLLPL